MQRRCSGGVYPQYFLNEFIPAAYSAAKASINNFTAWLAVRFAPRNVRVNAIVPGFLCTSQNRFLLSDAARFVTGTVMPVDGGFNVHYGV